MYTNPGKDRIPVDHTILEQFRRKGYKCEEICEEEATIFIIRHQKGEIITPVLHETYKDFIKTN